MQRVWPRRAASALALGLAACGQNTGNGAPNAAQSSAGTGGENAGIAGARPGGGGSVSTGGEGPDNTAGVAGSGASVAGGAGGAAGAGGAGGAGGTPATAAGGASGNGGLAGSSGAAGACKPSTGKALQFDGTLVDLMSGDLGADLPPGDQPRTIELWAKFLGAQSWKAEGSILETGLEQPPKGGGSRVFGLDLSGYSGTTAEFGPYTSGYSDNNHPNGVYVPNIPQTGWLHLAWSYSGNHGELSFTVDGAQYPVITMAGKPTLNFTTGIVTLAASQTFGTAGWSGVMDELRLWSVARSPEQIKSTMHVLLKGTEPGLVAYYPFNEGSGSFTDDVKLAAGHRLTSCTAAGPACPAANVKDPTWVDSDIPGTFSCAP